MKIGLMAPQGWKGEYDEWDPAQAWARTVDLAIDADTLGFDALWTFDHFHTVPEVSEEITFESFSVLSALAMATRRIRLGQLVACAGFRNPALTAKIASTIDVISGGRFELGMGAGWKEDEWRAYGYGFPPISRRLTMLADQLEVIRRMLEPGTASYEGRHVHVRDAVNEPKGLQSPRIPLIVGGNGQRVTWKLAARYADELNVVYLTPEDTARALPLIEAHCRHETRDPATLGVSVYIPDELIRREGQERVDLLGAYQDLGIARVTAFLPRAIFDREAQARLAEDAAAAGVELARPVGLPRAAAVAEPVVALRIRPATAGAS